MFGTHCRETIIARLIADRHRGGNRRETEEREWVRHRHTAMRRSASG
jgi:hypothetical protein